MSRIRLAHIAASMALGLLEGCAPTPGQPVTSPVLAPVTALTTTRDLATTQQVVASGHLVCQVGPTVSAKLNPSGSALLAKGAAKSAVDAACGAVNGVATALSDVSTTPAGIVVRLPSSVTVPTAAS